MTRLTTAFILLLCVYSTAVSQAQPAQKPNQVNTRLTVRGNVSAQAVLIPRVNARRIFGEEIANNYAVIEINVGNHSPDAALLIHGIFIDYSRWPLSGNGAAMRHVVGGLLRESDEPFQASTTSNQIASEEYRVVRGQLLDAQMWSRRNWTMRLLTLAGSLASAYAFSIGEEGIVRGLNAFSGTVIPGVKEAWPDGTIEQLNRISDFGYQTNKVIPKQGAEVIVCFFPIDRFLTPGFKKLFLRSPALFFSPLQMLVDTTMKPEVDKLLHGINEKASVKTLAPLLPCYLEISTVLNTGERRSGIIDYGAGRGCEDKFGLQTVNDPKQRDVFYQIVDADRFESLFITLDFLAQMSLNSVTVTVDGVMTVDTTNIPPSTDGLAFDRLENCGDEKEPCFWTDLKAANGVRTGTITGSYLTGGNVVIAEEKDLGLTDIKTISDGSSDQKVRFSFRLTKPIPSDTKLHFVVSKAQPGTSGKGSLDSPPREHLVGYTMNAPAITNLKQAGNKLTITGLNFFDVPPDHSLIVKLVAPDGTEFEVKPDSATSEEIKVTIPGDAAPAGCWKVRVFVGDSFADSTDHGACLCFFVAPNPVVASAERKDNQIIVKGEDLIDTKSCGGPRLGFQLKKEGGTAIAATVIMFESPKLVILNLPAAVKDGKWTLQVLSNGQPVTGSTPVEIK